MSSNIVGFVKGGLVDWEENLKKYKSSDIVGFVKGGFVDWVENLKKYKSSDIVGFVKGGLFRLKRKHQKNDGDVSRGKTHQKG
jgi:hypothetical protein